MDIKSYGLLWPPQNYIIYKIMKKILLQNGMNHE